MDGTYSQSPQFLLSALRRSLGILSTLALMRRFASSKPAQVFEAQRGNI
jgi:hypothetical protein